MVCLSMFHLAVFLLRFQAGHLNYSYGWIIFMNDIKWYSYTYGVVLLRYQSYIASVLLLLFIFPHIFSILVVADWFRMN